MRSIPLRVLIGAGALSVGLFVAAGLLLSQGKTLGERHTAVALPEQFDYSTGSFADHIAHSRRAIEATRLDNPSAAVLANLAPFMLEPPAACPRTADGKVDKGIVLIHGLIDSPYSMRAFGEHLQAQCFYVLGLLLPDHALRPGNFVGSRWEAWAEATHFATRELARHADTLFLSGHSAGGTLAILEAARNPEVDALILFAPALAISPASQYAQYVAMIGTVFPKAAWFEVRPDEAVYRYESFPFSAAAETWALIAATHSALAERTRDVPVFTVATLQDNTVGTQATLDFMAANTDPRSHTLLYSQYPHTAGDRIEVVSSSAPEQNVLSVSHLGLMTPPSHPYYGRDGAYRNCGHYFDADAMDAEAVDANAALFARCKNGERAYYGEVTPENLQLGLVERIAFNPFYADMVQRIDEFAVAIEQ